MKDFSLLETILYDPQQGFYLLNLHIARLLLAINDMNKNGHDFGSVESKDIINVLQESVRGNDRYLRVRLLLSKGGVLSTSHTDLDSPKPPLSCSSLVEAAKGGAVFSIVLDNCPSDVLDNPFVTHKTTCRDVYEDARHRSHCEWNPLNDHTPFDVVLWNKLGQVTETSIANLAIGTYSNNKWHWKTPHHSSGLLQGVFRQKLLEENDVEEVMITKEDLVSAHERGYIIVCFNSVRKIYRVRLLQDVVKEAMV
ncbi:aminotransferase [Phycomyces blakesleeanus]|uniref:Aminotransferase n=1 Tax=Phycomyces blakesleeanus TaxID=4837 RepID=A0ABR3AYD9_PHYBL